MSVEFRLSVLSTALLIAGLSSASVLSGIGTFTAGVPEDQLFIEEGKVLAGDLIYHLPNGNKVVAPKGFELTQTLPPVVWQYAGLLPVTDYLKPAAIHSVSSERQDRSWKEVQNNFYNGLLVEGADNTDAKIAYAGAYAFAPRWSSIEFVEDSDAGDTSAVGTVFKIEHTQPSQQGMTIESYRDLSLQILQQTNEISLQDIQMAIDATDTTETKIRERASLGGISNEPQSARLSAILVSGPDANLSVSESEAGDSTGIVVGGNGTLAHSGNGQVVNLADGEVTPVNEMIGQQPDKERDVATSLAGLFIDDVSEVAEPTEEGETLAIDSMTDSPVIDDSSNTDNNFIAVLPEPVAITAPREIVKLPVDQLFVSDELVAYPGSQEDKFLADEIASTKDITANVESPGASVDLSGLDKAILTSMPAQPEIARLPADQLFVSDNTVVENDERENRIVVDEFVENDEVTVTTEVVGTSVDLSDLDKEIFKPDIFETDTLESGQLSEDAAVAESRVIVKLPVGQLFVTDRDVDVPGLPTDESPRGFRKLISDLFKPATPEAELSEVMIEESIEADTSFGDTGDTDTGNTTIGDTTVVDATTGDDWIALPDGTLVLQTFERLYTE